MSDPEPQHDLFISHASEDKEAFVRPLANALVNLGVSVWFDEFSLRVGDSLSRSIDRGLAGARYGVVVISKAFITKPWPERELCGLVAREVSGPRRKIILPIWHGVTQQEVLVFSPPLADKVALNTRDLGAEAIALQLLQEVRPDIYGALPRDELRRIASGEALDSLRCEIEETRGQLEKVQEELSEFQCLTGGAKLNLRTTVPIDDPHTCDYLLERYECGYEASDGFMSVPCPYDVNYPTPEQYELSSVECAAGQWMCFAKPKTRMAHLVEVRHGAGKTREEAEADVRRRLPRRRPHSS